MGSRVEHHTLQHTSFALIGMLPDLSQWFARSLIRKVVSMNLLYLFIAAGDYSATIIKILFASYIIIVVKRGTAKLKKMDQNFRGFTGF